MTKFLRGTEPDNQSGSYLLTTLQGESQWRLAFCPSWLSRQGSLPCWSICHPGPPAPKVPAPRQGHRLVARAPVLPPGLVPVGAERVVALVPVPAAAERARAPPRVPEPAV